MAHTVHGSQAQRNGTVTLEPSKCYFTVTGANLTPFPSTLCSGYCGRISANASELSSREHCTQHFTHNFLTSRSCLFLSVRLSLFLNYRWEKSALQRQGFLITTWTTAVWVESLLITYAVILATMAVTTFQKVPRAGYAAQELDLKISLGSGT